MASMITTARQCRPKIQFAWIAQSRFFQFKKFSATGRSQVADEHEQERNRTDKTGGTPEDLNFMRAAEILFSPSKQPPRLGLDFQIWQAFVACLPPLTVYLVALYARAEMRRMEKENETEEAEALRKKIEGLQGLGREGAGRQATGRGDSWLSSWAGFGQSRESGRKDDRAAGAGTSGDAGGKGGPGEGAPGEGLSCSKEALGETGVRKGAGEASSGGGASGAGEAFEEIRVLKKRLEELERWLGGGGGRGKEGKGEEVRSEGEVGQASTGAARQETSRKEEEVRKGGDKDQGRDSAGSPSGGGGRGEHGKERRDLGSRDGELERRAGESRGKSAGENDLGSGGAARASEGKPSEARDGGGGGGGGSSKVGIGRDQAVQSSVAPSREEERGGGPTQPRPKPEERSGGWWGLGRVLGYRSLVPPVRTTPGTPAPLGEEGQGHERLHAGSQKPSFGSG